MPRRKECPSTYDYICMYFVNSFKTREQQELSINKVLYHYAILSHHMSHISRVFHCLPSHSVYIVFSVLVAFLFVCAANVLAYLNLNYAELRMFVLPCLLLFRASFRYAELD